MTFTAFITGASSGIGYELAKILAENGTHLILVSRNEGKLNDIKKQLEDTFSIKVQLIIKDLSIPGSSAEVFAQIKNEPIDIVINNAGFGDFGFFKDSELEKITSMMHLNIVALTELTHLLLPSMIKQKSGKIMNVASLAAFQPGPLMAVYYATKAYVLSFSEAISNELQKTGVTVTALCPGPTKTGFADVASLEFSKLFTSLPIASARDVAKFGYKAMMKGQVIAIPGFLNTTSAFLTRFFPRRFVRSMARKIQEYR
jgi:short-subunit dehydrogenase